jgi:hypothetical protein
MRVVEDRELEYLSGTKLLLVQIDLPNYGMQLLMIVRSQCNEMRVLEGR